MTDDTKNIGPESEKPGNASPENKVEPVKDTSPTPEQPPPKLGLTVEEAAIL